MSDQHPDAWFIVGDDALEYGPVAVETIRRWIDEGRVVASTRMRRGDGPWQAACDQDGLGMGFPDAPGPGDVPPPVSGARALPPLTTARLPVEFEAMAFFKEAWRLLRAEDIALLGVVLFVLHAMGQVPYFGGIAALIITGPVYVGVNRAILARLGGHPITFETIMSGFDRFWPACAAGIAVGLATLAGFALLIAPGLWLSVVWTFVFVIMAETERGAFEAMGASYRLTEGHRWGLFAMLLLSFLFMLLGLLAFGIGFYVALPVIATADVLAYRWLQRRGRQPA